MSWQPLNVHSQYSVLQATSSIDSLVARAKALEFKAMALTDSGNLHGAVEFSKACQTAGIQPLLGIEVFEAPDARTVKVKEPNTPAAFSLTLIAKSAVGYRNLCRLSTLSYLEGFYYVPRIDRLLLRECSEGLIALVGSPKSRIGHHLRRREQDLACRELRDLQSLFGEDLYLRLQSYEMSEEHLRCDAINDESWLLQRYRDEIAFQSELNRFLQKSAAEAGAQTVISQECYFLERVDWRAHQVLLNVCSGETMEIWQRDAQGKPSFKTRNPKRQTLSSHEYYFKSKGQIEQLFPGYDEALKAPSRIAAKCDFELDFTKRHYPVFPAPLELGEDRPKSAADVLYALARASVQKRYGPHQLEAVRALYPNQDPMQVVLQRLESEFEVIASKEMADYLLIVGDFICWAKEQKIPVGPGRGSGAGSILCYLIGITDIEPLRFQLFFERFINPERASYPDIDVDICMVRRPEVIGYLLSRYGVDCVAHIITFGKMKAKLAIKDVGRVLNVPLAKVVELAKLIPEDPNATLSDALRSDQQLQALSKEDEETQKLLELAKTVEGSIRNTGVHAAGVIIGGQPLVQVIPLCVAKDSAMPAAQFSMKPLEELGLLKIDVLGLKTLTCIQEAVDAVERSRHQSLNWTDLPLDDVPTYALLNQGKTQGVFQLESGGMQDLARNLHLDRFEEIIAVLSLYRPGPMEMIPSFISRKHGREPIELDHPWLDQILSETYGIMVYQEQVMQIAQKLAGYTLAEGDVLRRAMGKKDREEMAGQRKKFLAGAKSKGIERQVAELIFGKIEKFAQYGFNKSHAAAYGYLTYATAYLKANFTAEWMAALMTHDNKDTERVADCIAESRSLGLCILPPDVNESGTTFRAAGTSIRFALSAVKGIGEGAVEAILRERQKGGEFSDLDDFIRRVDARKLGKRGIELLVEVGAFDFMQRPRDALRLAIEPLWERAQKQRRDRQKGVISLFAVEEKEQVQNLIPDRVPNPLTPAVLLRRERELLGFYLTGNPLDLLKENFEKLKAIPLKAVLEDNCPKALITAFIVEEITIKLSQRTQKKFAILTVSDGVRRWELPLWSDVFQMHAAKLQLNAPLGAVLSVDRSEGVKLTCLWLCDLENLQPEDQNQARSALARAVKRTGNTPSPAKSETPLPAKTSCVCIWLDMRNLHLSQLRQLKQLALQNPGSSQLELTFSGSYEKIYVLKADIAYSVSVNSPWLNEVSKWKCVTKVQVN